MMTTMIWIQYLSFVVNVVGVARASSKVRTHTTCPPSCYAPTICVAVNVDVDVVCGLDFRAKDHRWVYKCEKCWYYAHPNCATSRTEPFMSILSSSGLGKKTKNYIDAQHPDLLHLPFSGDVNKYINIKFRGSHSIKDHPHPDLSFVQGLASDGNCTTCQRALQYKLIFKCSQCKFAIDYDCCKELSSYRDEDEDFDADELSNSNSD
nr:zinc finger, PHD-type [Tanacetum cinerariifolium]